jgi:hypothetical protein
MDDKTVMKNLEADIQKEVAGNAEGDPPSRGETHVPPRMPLAGVAPMPRANFQPAGEEPRTHNSVVVPGYEQLSRILGLAYGQAAHGKGKTRHSSNMTGFKPWHSQPILELARMTGPGASAYQIMKKAQEACGMVERGDLAGAKAEALGAIVYAAALYKLIEEIETPSK